MNYRIVTEKMAEQYEAMGGEYLLDTEIINLKEGLNEIKVIATNETFVSKYLICCAGLMADRMANFLDIKTNFQIIPFRGEYFKLPKKHNTLVKHLIYPIPNPKLPFLGIHLTRMIDGSITVGPNAVIGFKREGYGIVNFSLKDTIEMLTFKGFRGVLKNHFRSGMKGNAELFLQAWLFETSTKICFLNYTQRSSALSCWRSRNGSFKRWFID